MKYDYLIVGAGLFGSVFAEQMTKHGAKCLVIDKRDHIGGNCYTYEENNINIHKYGPHIFHTNNEKIWKYINRFCSFNNYIHRPKVRYKNEIFSFPINLFTLYQLWGVKTPQEAKDKLNNINNPSDHSNLESYIISKLGKEIYLKFFRGYTFKQWGKDPKELPASIVKRLPIRLNYNDNYFFDKYQGIPIGGYTQIFDKLLSKSDVKLGIEFEKNNWNSLAHKLVLSMPLDEYYDFQYGMLEYRSLRFVNKTIDKEDFQGNSIINYTDENIPYTRITEHKHFENSQSKNTIITYEYSQKWNRNNIPYYPINSDSNNNIHKKYMDKFKSETNIIGGGRLFRYQYMDMDQVIGNALNLSNKEIK